MNNFLDVGRIKNDFPIFKKRMRNGSRLVYLDSGATTQKPLSVIEAEGNFYKEINGAVHRGSHLLAEAASEAFENSRELVAEFIGAPSQEVIFTKSATESLNLLAYSIGNTKNVLSNGDEILVTEMEHHANLIPWQELARRTGAHLRWIPVNSQGRLDYEKLNELLNFKTKIVAITAQSNVLGTLPDLNPVIKLAREFGALVFVDGCQAIPHQPTDVLKLGVDAYVFSAHKMLGPTGVGVLWAKSELLNRLEPFLFGGSMIESVTMERSTWAPIPRKFESGVPNMAGVIAFGAAIRYLKSIGMEKIGAHLDELTTYTLGRLSEVSALELFGPKDNSARGGVFSFSLAGIHPHDVGQLLDQHGIAVRTGHHCAWPLMKKFGLTGTTRASLYLYNDKDDIDALVFGLNETKKYFKV